MYNKVMEHYYTQMPSGEYKEHKLDIVVSGRKISFLTADGVFSKSSLDFGTAVLLEAFFSHHKKIGDLLDLGCGYGVIGISAALIAGAKPTMRDINQRAVELAKKNAQTHDVKAYITQGDGYTDIEKKFDIIITNPPIRAGKKAYYPWVQNAPRYLNEGGEFWAVVQKKQGAQSFIRLLEEAFGACETITREAGYHVMRAKK